MDIPIVDGLSEDQVLTLAYCRSYDQYVAMLEDYRAGRCSFCDPMDPDRNRVIRAHGDWRMWMNPFPIAHSRLHLILSPRRHVAAGDPILTSDFIAMGGLFVWAQNEFGFSGGGFAMRFGSPKESMCSVLHLHANIIVPDQTGNVRVTLSKEPHEIAEQIARMHVFEKIRCGAKPTDLTAYEWTLVSGRL